MRIEKLTFDHKELLYERLKKIDTPVSEYSFANLYLFRKNHDYEVVFDEEIFIRGKTYDGSTYLMPAFDVRNADVAYLKGMMKNADFFFPVSEEWLSVFTNGEFAYFYNENDTDYLYTVEKMCTFKGNKLHKKKNLLNQFMSLYEHDAYPLIETRMEDAYAILEQWQEDMGESREETDYYPCQEALKLYDDLIICGGIYYVNKEPGGFIIGEEMNDETFALHFAKGKKKFKGLYQYMYNTFANILPKNYQWMNFEQDLGKMELRIAKSSYVPDMMVKKYRVKCK
ncbi:MAG: phosphatidylglycerol lysyltransferase domain-containing protein [Proteobacteria bacterium]|nr:phosphatidylglycerol lysyltransferase domain-containing protein [Pseudomonadota bacterium]